MPAIATDLPPDSDAGDCESEWTPHLHQIPPLGDWSTWLLLGGRGAGKTRAGAEWVRSLARDPVRIALVGPTHHSTREVMIEGESGLLNIGPLECRPKFEPTRRRLVWPSGAIGQLFTAEEADRLRGPQFHFAWADEFCSWRGPSEVLAMLRFGLRLGQKPRLMITTTPRPIRALRHLIAEPLTRDVRAPTRANQAHLAPAFLADLQRLYGGTRLAAQELEGQIVEDSEAALWRASELEACRGPRPPELDRVIVGVDPSASMDGDACGIVVAGSLADRGYVLFDATQPGRSPMGWARRVCDVARRWAADEIVAEANQGGEMVRTILSAAEPPCRVRLVHARLGKRARAEPVAALYEQGRITHCGTFHLLEEELMALGSEDLSHSPDRADALVWALSALLIEPRRRQPRVQVL
jgi:phage terminase large subunit-like protein